jgi:hypothetical protein
MTRTRIFFIAPLLLLMLLAVACNRQSPADVTAGSDAVDEEEFLELDHNNFDDSTTIDNQWLPMRPGTQWTFEGSTFEDDQLIPHRLVFTVTDLTKEIDGVPTLVAYIEDYSDDELVEAEIAFYAQDNDGNVWYLGEYPEEYEDGELVDAPAWIAGTDGAKAGIQMKAEPRLDTPSYPQGWAPSVEWTDRGQVYKMAQQACVPVKCYADVLVIDEFNQEEPGAFQQKYYARGVGNIQVGWRGEETQQEELGLVDLVHLKSPELAQVRQAALALEDRAYEVSADVYAQTSPSQPLPQAVVNTEVSEQLYEAYDRGNFNASTNIDNAWLPMQPGTQWRFEGVTVEDGELFSHELIFTITDLVKEIDGVPTVVAWIEDYSQGQLIEAEIAFYAQDDDGNVWYFGEYPEEYENGQFVGAPTWIAGLEGSRPGIKMPFDPQLGTSSFSQGLSTSVGWTDRGQVYRMNQRTCVPFDCYENAMIMDEFNVEEPGAIQLKYYAPGVGQIRVGFRGDDLQPEMLELVERVELDGDALAKAGEAALALEARAYEISPDVYGKTSPAEYR